MLAAQMVRWWANFARTGDPNGEGTPDDLLQVVHLLLRECGRERGTSSQLSGLCYLPRLRVALARSFSAAPLLRKPRTSSVRTTPSSPASHYPRNIRSLYLLLPRRPSGPRSTAALARPCISPPPLLSSRTMESSFVRASGTTSATCTKSCTQDLHGKTHGPSPLSARKHTTRDKARANRTEPEKTLETTHKRQSTAFKCHWGLKDKFFKAKRFFVRPAAAKLASECTAVQ